LKYVFQNGLTEQKCLRSPILDLVVGAKCQCAPFASVAHDLKTDA